MRRRFATASTFECALIHARCSGDRPCWSGTPRDMPLSISQSTTFVTGAFASVGAFIPPSIA